MNPYTSFLNLMSGYYNNEYLDIFGKIGECSHEFFKNFMELYNDTL
jgi:hypothetical protein